MYLHLHLSVSDIYPHSTHPCFTGRTAFLYIPAVTMDTIPASSFDNVRKNILYYIRESFAWYA